MKRVLFGLALLLLAGTTVFAFSTVFGSRSALVVSPDHLEFGEIAAGESERQVVVVTNTSDETIAIERIAASPPFGVARDSLSLGARQSQVIMVTFSPTESGRSEGRVTLESSLRAGGTRSVKLEGSSHQPAEIAVEPLFLSFGAVRVGETGKASITVANHGEVDLELSSLAIGRPFRAEIDSTSVASGTSRSIEVYFEPTLAREYDRSLTIRSNDPERRRVFVSMDGTGVDEDPAARIQVSPANLEFGSVVVGKSQTRRVSIRNGGDDPLTLTALLAPAHFAVPTRSRLIQPGEELVLPVSFSPGREGALRGALRIYSNDPEQRELAVSLRGAGQTRAVVAVADGEGTLAGGTRAVDDAAGGSRGTGEVLGGPWATSNPGGDALGGESENGEAGLAVADERGAGETSEPETGEEEQPGEEEQLVALAPNTLEGGEIRLDSYRELLSEVHASVSYDPDSRAFAIQLQLPTVDAALGEYFEFEPTVVMGRFDAYGEANVETTLRMKSFRGLRYEIPVTLKTGTSTLDVKGAQIAVQGRPLGADGRPVFVGLAHPPDNSPFGGDAMTLRMNVHVAR